MVGCLELREKISQILNGLDDATSSIFNPATSFTFLVNAYGTHLDKIADKKLKKDVIPCYIGNFTGSVEPIPNLREENLQYEIFIYFPLKYRTTFFRMGDFIVDCFAGKVIDFGGSSGKAIANVSVPSLLDIQQAEMISFGEFLKENYNLPIQRTDLWGVLSFTLYLHQVANLGLENGFIVGNQITHRMSFTWEGKTYEENLVIASTARNLNADILSEQIINDKQTLGVSKNTSYIDSVQAYVRDNEFWRKFIFLYELGELQNVQFTYVKEYHLSKLVSFRKSAYITQCPTSDNLGATKTFTFTLVKPIGSAPDIGTIFDHMHEVQFNAITRYQMIEKLGEVAFKANSTFEDFEVANAPIFTNIKFTDVGLDALRFNTNAIIEEVEQQGTEKVTFNAVAMVEQITYEQQV